MNILEVEELVTTFDTEKGALPAVDGASFSVKKGSVLGIVGESGCGKSVTCLSVMRLLPKPSGKIPRGRILFGGRDIVAMAPREIRKLRGDKISMIFQEPMTALNPVHTIGKQLIECYNLHRPDMKPAEKFDSAADMLRKVGIPSPEKRMAEYPHQLSGGMRQRVVIAIALACGPELLIADEPTTALDVTIQAQILTLMRDLQKSTGMTIIFITHDLAVVAEMCKEVVVMYAGKIVESGSVDEIFHNPKHPYTLGLLSSMPTLETPRDKELVEIEGMVPDLFNLPKGCRFENRCPHAADKCRQGEIPITEIAPGPGSTDASPGQGGMRTPATRHEARCLRIGEF